MANVALDSQLDPVLDRRKQLRYQRRLKFLQASWRTLVISGLAGGLIWAAYLPEWVIRWPRQVSIKGNQLLSTQAIQSLLPLSYPQNLIRLQPELIAEALESGAPIDKAMVTRRLFPPGLTVVVQERYPVAVIPCLANHDCASTSEAASLPFNQKAETWLLDSRGVVVSLINYPALQEDPAKIPKLTVLGMLKVGTYAPKVSNKLLSQYGATNQVAAQSERTTVVVDKKKQSQWPHLYRALSRSPVKVSQVDWRDATNLILKTELGTVHLGPYSSKLVEQLNALDQMRKLSKYLSSNQVGYINLENPERPLLQLKNTAKSDLPEKPVVSPY